MSSATKIKPFGVRRKGFKVVKTLRFAHVDREDYYRNGTNILLGLLYLRLDGQWEASKVDNTLIRANESSYTQLHVGSYRDCRLILENALALRQPHSKNND